MGLTNPRKSIQLNRKCRCGLVNRPLSLKAPTSIRGFRGFLFGFNWCRFPIPKMDDSGTMIEKDRPTGFRWPTLCFRLSDDKEASTLHTLKGSVST